MDASGALASAPSSAAPSGSRSPMFPPGADREEWGPRFNCAPSTSAAASQAMPASGRKRKANFSNDETETLVWNVVRHFSALYGSEALRAHPVRRKQLWTQIQSRVNFLGYTERSIDDLKHKWRDLRLDVKKKITSKKHLPMNRISARVNFLGYTERSIDDLKHKWRDLRLDVKKKITSKKHLPMNRAGKSSWTQ
ncbi:PREDICTED: t-SNARE domain-containing protein 1-like, partial [Leptosomus discolor]|uniref:t-SNARE domain-containing protein 1-like n=1 Tax=Leptosomus discolor TaxID=188344 RepID=UPI000522456E